MYCPSYRKRARKIIRSGYTGNIYDIQRLAELATNLAEVSLACFLRGDLETSRSIPGKDKNIDKLLKAIGKQVNKQITQSDLNPIAVPILIDLLLLSKSLERVGGHTVNIAMEMIYFLTGEDIRLTNDAHHQA